ncbi:PAS domain S-box-containing protein [Daejeonella rubra]|uniref:histidine kinase n=1 Tax=Daejeonella rubra TaxID=990371 RepID=A0A1G9Y8C2_9SPHI|nr:PAS domain S-box protein [Daejeonella rubra]SDN05338.1 PAS domain S-box-containing protein [Daejeonella rubra]
MNQIVVGSENENFRLNTLNDSQIMELLPKGEYESITRLACYICNKPNSKISIIDSGHLSIRSIKGTNPEGAPLLDSFCQFTIRGKGILEIKDALEDSRSSRLTCVSGDKKLRFYAGVPLICPDGGVLGVLSVTDTVPGELDHMQKDALSILAQGIVSHLESRRKNIALKDLILKYEDISTMFNSSAELHCILDRSGKIQLMNTVVERLLGYTPEEVVGRPIWDFFFEEDMYAMVPIIEKGLASGKKGFELEGRIKLKNGSTKWMGWSISVKNEKWFANGRDITDQKKMVGELEQLSLVASKINNGVVICDEKSRVLWVNDATKTITGYGISDLKGRKLGDVIKGKETDLKVIRQAREFTKNKKPFSVDLLAYKKDGSPIWLSILNSVLLDKNGKIEKEVEVIIDITARKKTEQELEILSTVASKSSSGIVIRDGNGKVTWINKALENMLGYKFSELVGKRLGDVLVGKLTDTQSLEVAENALNEKKSYNIDLRLYKKDGSEIWVNASTTPILNDKDDIERQVEIIIDITERKHVEEQLTLLSLVASKTVNGVAISSSDGKIKWVNQSLEDLTGYTLEDFKNTRPGDLLAGEGTDRALLNSARGKAINCIPSYIELLSYKKDGTPIWLAISNTPTFNKDGSLDQQVEIINDISERKLAEQELIKTREEALQLSKAKETFLSVMSHEIRTPLNAVIGMSHILMDDNPTESQIENLKILGFSAQNLLNLINDVLDFTKIETGNMVLESVNVNLKDLVSQTLNSLQFRTAEKAVILKSEIDHRIPTYVMGDNTRLYQILINLLGNSIKFTEKGEVKLKVDLFEENKKSVKVRFEIRDTGIGIAPDKIDYIFQSYAQADTDTTRKYGGTGLGLAITKSLLELHNSQILVESELGKGSVFSFIIEFNRSVQSNMQVENKTQIQPLSGNILVVDDNEINRLLASKVLAKWGVQVDFAENGQIALEKTQMNNYDLILMDLHMPVMDGMEASKAIRKLGGHHSRVPIIALTASLFAHELETISECGMDGFVIKPFVPIDLYNKIKTFLSVKD